MICQTNDVALHKDVRLQPKQIFSVWPGIRPKITGYAPYICEDIKNSGYETVEVNDSGLDSNYLGRGVCPFESFQRDLQEISEIPFLTRVEHEVEVLNKQSVSAAVPAEAAARSEEINSAIRAFEQIETTANDNPNDNQEPE